MPDEPPFATYLKSPSGVIHYVNKTYSGGSDMQTYCSEYICDGDDWEIVDRPSSGDKVCKKCRVARRGRGTRGIYRPMKPRPPTRTSRGYRRY